MTFNSCYLFIFFFFEKKICGPYKLFSNENIKMAVTKTRFVLLVVMYMSSIAVMAEPPLKPAGKRIFISLEKAANGLHS